MEIADLTTNRHTFVEIYTLLIQGKRVVMFQIPPAPHGIPIPFNGHFYARDHESLVGLGTYKFEKIRAQVQNIDWSAAIIEGADLLDLDTDAIAMARSEFKKKFPNKALEVDGWDDITFLNKAKITRKGKITRTAIILLGLSESEQFLTPTECKIRWVLKSKNGDQKDYAIFSSPMILAVNEVFAKIRNFKYRYLRDQNTLFPEEVDTYDAFTIREAINNCIAHQDYTIGGRINVVEFEEGKIQFTNKGQFIPESVEKVVTQDAPDETYRNMFLATAMFNVNMVDTAGGGIRKMFTNQVVKFFPLPEYDLTNRRVDLTILGRVLDMDYATILYRNTELSLVDIIMLDKVQKGKLLTVSEVKTLKKRGLIEGRKPNYYLSQSVAVKTSQVGKYSKKRGLTKQLYFQIIKEQLAKHGSLSRHELDEILIPMLSSTLVLRQKKNKVSNLLSALRKNDEIKNVTTMEGDRWILVD